MANRQSETANTVLQARTVGRRSVLAGLAVAPIAGTVVAAEPDEVERVLAAWREWRPLCEDAALTPRMNALYKAVPDSAKNPQVQVLDEWCWSDEHIDQTCDRAPAWMKSVISDVWRSAKQELQDMWLRAGEHLELCGYEDLERQSEELMRRQGPLVEQIEGSNSNHPIVIAAKIDMALSEAPSDNMFGDCPWVPISAIVRALLPYLPADMAAALELAAEERGRIGELFGLQEETLS